MRKPMICLVLALPLAVFAQQQAEQPEETGTEAAVEESVVVAEQAPVAPPEEPLTDAEIEEMEVPEDEIEIATGDSEFTPEEEISEDFPVPLPADI
jgi:hypothetical protein